MKRILIATDLDHTLIPIGDAPESLGARELFAELVAQDWVQLVYVSGRSSELIDDMVMRYNLPVPDFKIADVGCSVQKHGERGYFKIPKWSDLLQMDWGDLDASDIIASIGELEFAEVQTIAGQAKHKISFNVSEPEKLPEICEQLHLKLIRLDIQYGIVTDIDEVKKMAYIDVLPATANKLTALQFLMRSHGYSNNEVVFSGDSGNDMAVLESDIPSTIVANATDKIKREALKRSDLRETQQNLYIATGMDELGLNGNYAAGIIEGVCRYHPEIKALLLDNVPA